MLAKTMEMISIDQTFLFHLEEIALEMSKRYDIKINIKKLTKSSREKDKFIQLCLITCCHLVTIGENIKIFLE